VSGRRLFRTKSSRAVLLSSVAILLTIYALWASTDFDVNFIIAVGIVVGFIGIVGGGLYWISRGED